MSWLHPLPGPFLSFKADAFDGENVTCGMGVISDLRPPRLDPILSWRGSQGRDGARFLSSAMGQAPRPFLSSLGHSGFLQPAPPRWAGPARRLFPRVTLPSWTRSILPSAQRLPQRHPVPCHAVLKPSDVSSREGQGGVCNRNSEHSEVKNS